MAASKHRYAQRVAIRWSSVHHAAVVQARLRWPRFVHELEEVVRRHRLGAEIADEARRHGIFDLSPTQRAIMGEVRAFVKERWGPGVAQEIHRYVMHNLEWLSRPVEEMKTVIWVRCLTEQPFRPLYVADERTGIRESRVYQSTAGPP